MRAVHWKLAQFVGILVPAMDVVAKSGPEREEEEMTCGQELAANADVPEKLARLMRHVATNMEAHAAWVGHAASGKQEHDALELVAREYHGIADAAGRAAAAMKSMKDIPVSPHDPSRFDRAGQARWMRAKIEMQEDFARLLSRHADVSKKALAELEGKPARSSKP